jgi:hypothetical protein
VTSHLITVAPLFASEEDNSETEAEVYYFTDPDNPRGYVQAYPAEWTTKKASFSRKENSAVPSSSHKPKTSRDRPWIHSEEIPSTPQVRIGPPRGIPGERSGHPKKLSRRDDNIALSTPEVSQAQPFQPLTL